ncbi:MAG: hypothetical protein KC417_13990, partial [Myxococcales bacterium]|nr:hypothetical protein [Myxococcales bacterium]
MAKRIARALILALLAGGILAGCHASEDDPAGLAGELEDPVRREHAIANIQRLYSQALSASKGDRNAPEVTAVVDATVEKLSAAYLAHREDTQNGTYIMRLLADMRDPRSLPALIGALEWRSEVNEEHAVAAAETLQHIAIPADKLGAVITALS